jgi:hypothetical protein
MIVILGSNPYKSKEREERTEIIGLLVVAILCQRDVCCATRHVGLGRLLTALRIRLPPAVRELQRHTAQTILHEESRTDPLSRSMVCVVVSSGATWSLTERLRLASAEILM